jgi:hypothetical protein
VPAEKNNRPAEKRRVTTAIPAARLIAAMTRRITTTALLVLAATIAATSARAAEVPQATLDSAGAFAAQILQLEVTGQWERQYALLNPGHRQLITKGQYVACSRPLGTAIGPQRFVVRESKLVTIRVPHVAARIAALVTVEMHRPESKQVATFHVHVVPADGRWTWILGKSFLQALAAGRCLYGAPLSSSSPSA